MMKKHVFLFSTLALVMFMSCTETENKDNSKSTVSAEAHKAETDELNKDAIVNDLKKIRLEIEATYNEDSRVVIETDSLREQIKQKWDYLHVYYNDEQVVRIKSYPYKDISTRTEEFYFKDGELTVAVVQDKGAVEDDVDSIESKVFYYHENNLIDFTNETSEQSYSIRDSDGERLQQEATEYLELISNYN